MKAIIKFILLTFISIVSIQLTVSAKDNNTNKLSAIDLSKYDSLYSVGELRLKESKRLTGEARYPQAYDNIWEVLSLSDLLKNTQLKYLAYQQLAMLYSIFHSGENALSCVDSMFFYLEQGNLKHSATEKLNLNYTAALTYRMNKRYDLANKHLDICFQLHDSLHSPFNKRLYTMAERAVLYIHKDKYNEAEQILKSISDSISHQHSYNSILYSIRGDLHLKRGHKKIAQSYYKKSLASISEQNMRIGLKVDLLKKLSNINEELGNYKKALGQMTESKLLGDSLFGSQSTRNSELFEIKDSYRLTLEKHQNIQREQNLKILENEKDKLNQRLTFTILLLSLLLISSIVVFRLIRHKHLAEKKLVSERTSAELKVKKKELAVTALQLIEKDKLLEEVKNGLEELQNIQTESKVEQIKSTIRVNSAKTWEEFEARFVQVNSTFYESLGKKHPTLSRSELKLCALIKLNFSSKEMAQLLGISPDSINKARYRLRKKLNLNQNDKLVQYINSL